MRGPLAFALALGLSGACHDSTSSSASSEESTGAAESSTSTGEPAGDPLPPRPDVIPCRFDGHAPGLLPPVVLTPVWPEIEAPVDLVASGDITYVAGQDGRIWSVDPQDPSIHTLVIDLGEQTQRVVALALPPDHATSGQLFVRYEAAAGIPRTVVARITVDFAMGVAELSSLVIVMEIVDAVGPQSGGALTIGPDGFLFIGVGDLDNGADNPVTQDLSSRLGKILRVDPSTIDETGTYAIPPDNPFAEMGGVAASVWATGVRDPVRCAIRDDDPKPWCIDVGPTQNEIDHVAPRADLGWPAVDGVECRLYGGDCSNLEVDSPSATYRSVDGDCGISGLAFPTQPPEFQQTIVYVDRCSGRVRGLKQNSDDQLVQDEILARVDNGLLGLARDGTGAVYAWDGGSGLGRVEVAPSDDVFPLTLSASGCFEDLAALAPSPGVIPFDLNSPLWTDGAIKHRFMVIPPGQTIGIDADGLLEFPLGTILLKFFSFEDGTERRAVETRVMVLREFGWQFHSYRWNDEGDDAEVLDSGAVDMLQLDEHGTVTELEYTWPSRGNCKVCHGLGRSNALGPRIAQLDREFDYGPASANQLDALAGVGMFSNPIPDAQAIPRIAAPDDPGADLESRARAYLHGNCGHCHFPGGWVPADLTMDLRGTTPLADTNTCGVATQYFNAWVEGETRIVAGAPEDSVIWQRINQRGFGQMPPLATVRVDPHASVVRDWIASLSACP